MSFDDFFERAVLFVNFLFYVLMAAGSVGMLGLLLKAMWDIGSR